MIYNVTMLLIIVVWCLEIFIFIIIIINGTYDY
jgi:hypothetical protein